MTETIRTPVCDLTTGSTFAGRYQVIEELGHGGMGRVYKVLDTKIGEKIALKLLRPEAGHDKTSLERFSNELKLARKIRHKNVCQMFDLGEDKGTRYITMEYVPGEDLKSFIRRSGQLTIGTSVKIAKQISEGLSEAHRLGVVHRDLKSSNIMIDKEGNARIMDFGIARSIEAKGVTDAGVMIGTPEYMSPEQAEAVDVDHRSDIYSLGVILYEMATGRLPFDAETVMGLILMHRNEKPRDPRELNPLIPKSLSQVIFRCLEKDRERRWQDARELFIALQAVEKPGADTADSPELKASIAVLPFKNVSADPEQEYFCEGLAEELINVLTQVKGLRVVARTSAFSFQGKDVDIHEIGKRLNVENVLEGSVRKAGHKLRITAQLINVADGYHLWSERFDREMTDVFAIQDEIAQAVSAKMKTGLQGDGIEGVAKRYTENIEAYHLYLKGIYWRRMLAPDRVSKSLEYFNRAIEKDPGYALAFAGLAYAYLVLSFYSPTPPKDAYLKARQAALKALELDNGLTEAHEALGVVKYYWERDWEGAEREFLRTLELNPGYVWSHFHLANIRLHNGRIDEAIEIFRKIHFLDPLNTAFKRNLGECYLYANQLREAEDTLRDTLEIDPSFPMTSILLGNVLSRQARYEDAVKAMSKDSLKGSVLELNIGIIYARMGKQEEALRILNDWLGRSEKEFVSPYYTALLCFALGKNDMGFQWLEKGYEERDGWLMNLKVDFLLDDVRDNPRFSALLTKMGLQ